MIVYFIYGAVLRCPLYHINGGAPVVGCCNMFWFAYYQCCGGDSSLNVDKWVMAYGSKADLILNAMVWFHNLNDL